ncbi:MAG TPA: hypothetical protein VKG01_06250 [Thermoanaerobaculia bacterium]|nr:hypothetical protein [Thermoanaerobaculia bacterium]
MAKEVRIELTDAQKAKIKAATGKSMGEIRVSNVGKNLAVEPGQKISAQDTSIQSEDTSIESADTSIESADTSIESADTSIESADTSIESADTSIESNDMMTTG